MPLPVFTKAHSTGKTLQAPSPPSRKSSHSGLCASETWAVSYSPKFSYSEKPAVRNFPIPAKPSCGQAAQNGGPASGVNGSGHRNKQKAFTFVPPKAGHSFCIISSRETGRAAALFWAAFFGPFLFGKRKGRKKVFVARIFKIYPAMQQFSLIFLSLHHRPQ